MSWSLGNDSILSTCFARECFGGLAVLLHSSKRHWGHPHLELQHWFLQTPWSNQFRSEWDFFPSLKDALEVDLVFADGHRRGIAAGEGLKVDDADVLDFLAPPPTNASADERLYRWEILPPHRPPSISFTFPDAASCSLHKNQYHS